MYQQHERKGVKRMDRNVYEYEQKLIEEVAHCRFSFKKIVKILKLSAIAGHSC